MTFKRPKPNSSIRDYLWGELDMQEEGIVYGGFDKYHPKNKGLASSEEDNTEGNSVA